jgi:uncharacterized protein with PIN domain
MWRGKYLVQGKILDEGLKLEKEEHFCESCGKILPPLSDEEIRDMEGEYDDNGFSGYQDKAIICDDCYNKLLGL